MLKICFEFFIFAIVFLFNFHYGECVCSGINLYGFTIRDAYRLDTVFNRDLLKALKKFTRNTDDQQAISDFQDDIKQQASYH